MQIATRQNAYSLPNLSQTRAYRCLLEDKTSRTELLLPNKILESLVKRSRAGEMMGAGLVYGAVEGSPEYSRDGVELDGKVKLIGVLTLQSADKHSAAGPPLA